MLLQAQTPALEKQAPTHSGVIGGVTAAMNDVGESSNSACEGGAAKAEMPADDTCGEVGSPDASECAWHAAPKWPDVTTFSQVCWVFSPEIPLVALQCSALCCILQQSVYSWRMSVCRVY